MHRIILTLIIGFPLFSFSQDVDSFDEQIDITASSIEYHRLEYLRHKGIMDSLVIYKSSLVNRKKLLNYSLADRYRVPTKTIMQAKLRKEADVLSPPYTTIPVETEIWVIGFREGYYLVEYKEYTGYVHEINLKQTEPVFALKGELSALNKKIAKEKEEAYYDSIKQFADAQLQRERELEASRRRHEQAKFDRALEELRQRVEAVRSIYGDEVADRVRTGEVWVGMPANSVKAALGEPRHTTTTENVYGTTQYLHYSNRLIVIKGDVVTSITINQ